MTFLFVYLNNAVRKFRYFVTSISQFVFYMMLQLSLKLSPSDKKHTIEKNSNFLFFEKRHKNEKIFAVWIKTANYKFSRFQHFERFPTNKLNKVDTKCSNFKSRPKFMTRVVHVLSSDRTYSFDRILKSVNNPIYDSCTSTCTRICTPSIFKRNFCTSR